MYDYDSIYESFISGDVGPLYSTLYPGFLIYAVRRLGSELSYLAEDCVQEAIIDSYRMRGKLKSSHSWYSYILKCIFNNALQHVRKNNSRSRYLSMDEPDAFTDELDVEMLEQEVLDMLHNAIESLPEKYRDLLRMSFMEGLKNSEIAQRLRVAEITVKKQKAKLIAMLREKMDGCTPSVIILLLQLHILEHV